MRLLHISCYRKIKQHFLTRATMSFPGDELVARALREYEVLPVDLLWEAADWYKQAIVLTREMEVRMETRNELTGLLVSNIIAFQLISL